MTDPNKRFAELTGVPYHSWETKGMNGLQHLHSDPDYAVDPRLVLREMMKRKDWNNFSRNLKYLIGQREYYGNESAVAVGYILDTTGKLRDAAIEFMEGKK